MRKIVALVALSALIGCSSVDCPVDNTVEAVYYLYDSDAQRVTLLDSLSVLSARKDGTDTLLLNKVTERNSFSLPVGYTTSEDTLVFRLTNLNLEDTVWIQKENYPHFESVDCSASFFHTITAVRTTHRFIDTLVVNNPSVTYDSSQAHFHLHLLSGD